VRRDAWRGLCLFVWHSETMRHRKWIGSWKRMSLLKTWEGMKGNVTSPNHGQSDNTVWRSQVDFAANSFVPPHALLQFPRQAYVILASLLSPRSSSQPSMSHISGLCQTCLATLAAFEFTTKYESYIRLMSDLPG